MNDSSSAHPFRIGLTGGIASGKSTVAAMFADLGIPVIDTDVIAREVVQPGNPALDEIADRFGKSVIDKDGNLDRRALRKIVFADSESRMDLERILHPRIGAETRRQADEANGSYQLIVVPLLVGSPLRNFVNRVLLVDCSEQTQIERLIARDAESHEQARRMLEAQVSREARLEIADDVIQNDVSIQHTLHQVAALNEKYRRLAESPDPV